VVAFIVQPGERNVIDQRLIEFGLLTGHGVKSVRVTLEEVCVGRAHVRAVVRECVNLHAAVCAGQVLACPPSDSLLGGCRVRDATPAV
jgi:hypothetical protein